MGAKMQPEHTRPFDLSSAKASAPYCCQNGDGATVHKWDCRGTVPLAGVVSGPDSDYPALWGASGISYQSRGQNLVMTPLGMIDGKPVFVGDLIAYSPDPRDIAPAVATDRDFSRCSWVSPAPAYPETKLDHGALADAALRHPGTLVATGTQLKAIANAAIRRAIDDGQVVLTSADRDMAIAEAVSAAYMRALYTIPGSDGIDLKAIVAGVAV